MATQWHATDKTFLITGGASGLGAEFAKTFLAIGAKKVAVLDVATEAGEAFVTSLNETYPGKAMFLKCDVSKEENIKSAFDKVLQDFKTIDVIINNAGIMNDSPQMWRLASDVNWQGVVSFTTKAVEHMRTDEGGAGGTIINISSSAAIFRFPILPIYSASKMAVLQFSQCLSMPPFFERTGVRILTICFGPTKTPLIMNLIEKSIDPKFALEFLSTVPSGHTQEVESAVKGLVEMYKLGSSGSVWMSAGNQPVKDITQVIRSAFEEFERVVKGELN
ncbi:15-hydroxyprostaglandin dehydrogenase [NAD(+)]-like [Zerene cesonia]|uniref:15-hydroxyprostaglandin dehydrogenase [NAD(+)]-like n=1 Tax=Zerene cesonia TaxID=33412 RepID=UPI0018E50CC3|nr:15-hydroxyprostaglandin dehydrogenase [NAD(+)]-like [Zerene cesonia]